MYMTSLDWSKEILMDTKGAVHLLDNERMCRCLGHSPDAVVTFDRGLR